MKTEKWRERQKSKPKTKRLQGQDRGSRVSRWGGRQEQQRAESSRPRNPLCRRHPEDGEGRSKPGHLLCLTSIPLHECCIAKRASPTLSVPKAFWVQPPSPPLPCTHICSKNQKDTIPTGPPSDTSRGTSTSRAGPPASLPQVSRPVPVP